MADFPDNVVRGVTTANIENVAKRPYKVVARPPTGLDTGETGQWWIEIDSETEEVVQIYQRVGFKWVSYLNDETKIAGLKLKDEISVEDLLTTLDVYPLIIGSDPPTASTKGYNKQMYFDIENATFYVCRGLVGSGYLWEKAFTSSGTGGNIDLSDYITKKELEETITPLSQVINTLNESAFPPSRNLLKLPDYSISAEENAGVSVSILDGLFTINGTSTAEIRLIIPIDVFDLPAGVYTYATKNIDSSLTTGVTVYIKDNNYANIDSVYTVLNSSLSKNNFTLTTDKTVKYLSISLPSGVTVNQTFNLQLEAGDVSTSYVPAKDKTFGGDTARTVKKLEDNVVYASSFHAIGDGVTDDTEALQRAIDYCSENYKLLKLDSGKTYLISSPLVWNENSVYFDGNFATIIAHEYMNSLIYLDCTDINDATATKDWGSRNFRQQIIKNLVLDCNGVVSTGLRIEKGIKTHCVDLTINNPVTYGIFVNQNGWENFISNIHITRLLEEVGGVGVYVNGSDNTFDNIVIIGCQVGVANIGSDNHYSKVHPWSTPDALENLKQSVSFDCRWGYCTFSQCIGDSTNIIFKISNNARVTISNCNNAWSSLYVENREDGSNPYLFYFDETHQNKGKDVIISACYFKPTVSEADATFKCYYSNLVKGDNPMLIDRATTGWENQPVTIERQVGSIDTALERIIEIQENLIGGVTE